MMSALPLALARLSKLWLPFLNHLLDADLSKNYFYFFIFCFFSCFQSWFYHILVHRFYQRCSFIYRNWWRHKLGHTVFNTNYIIILCSFFIEIDDNLASDGFNTTSWWCLIVAYFLGATLYSSQLKWLIWFDPLFAHLKCYLPPPA